jgi:hypothetical protein
LCHAKLNVHMNKSVIILKVTFFGILYLPVLFTAEEP